MATYSVEAFRWSGTGYNALYNTSYTAVLTDNDPNYQGGGDGGETVSINGGTAQLRLNLRSPASAAEMRAHETLAPVRMVAGALGEGLPRRDLLVSRQHRIQVSAPIAARMFGAPDVLIAAIRLTELPGIYVGLSFGALDYHHLVFDHHQTVLAEGAPAESFLIGREAIAALDPEARGEILTLFPQLARKRRTMPPASLNPARIQQKRLIARHAKNAKPLLGGASPIADAATLRLG